MSADERTDEPILDADFWEQLWTERAGQPLEALAAVELADLDLATAGLEPGSAIEAGCGDGRVSLDLARRGWAVLGVDLSRTAVARAAELAAAADAGDRASFTVGDLSTWTPERPADLVVSYYAHPELPHDDYVRRLAEWVAPGGALLVVGHGDPDHAHGGGHANGHGHGRRHGHGHDERTNSDTAPGHATATPTADIDPPASTWLPVEVLARALPRDTWCVDVAERRLADHGGRELHDAVLLAHRRA